MKRPKSTSGFVYIWFDKGQKRYYIGSHWGYEDDGYICGSSWMRNASNRRPEDFKRRIIKVVTTDRKDLYLEEQRYLNMIKVEEVRIRYYNIHLDVKKEMGQKGSPKFKDPAERARKISETKKRKFAERIAETGSAFSPEHIAKLSETHTGHQTSEETKQKQSKAHKALYASGERHSWNKGKTMTFADPEARSAKIRAVNLGKKLSLETIAKISATRKINRAKDNR